MATHLTLIKVRYRDATIHATKCALTTPRNLYGCFTLCGRRIADVDLWHEITKGAAIECGSCKRAAARVAKEKS